MPIRISGQGSGRPFLRYSPQADLWTQMGVDEPVEIDAYSSPLVFDITRLELGWLLLDPGVRDFQPWPSPDCKPRPEKPGDDYKVGFLVPVYSSKILGPEAHEFSSNAVANTRFIENLYNAMEKEPEFAEGDKAIAVQLEGTKATSFGKGKSREILYKVIKWVPRPAAFDAIAGDPSEGRKAAAPTKKGPPSPPPAPARAVSKSPPRPAPVADDEDEF